MTTTPEIQRARAYCDIYRKPLLSEIDNTTSSSTFLHYHILTFAT